MRHTKDAPVHVVGVALVRDGRCLVAQRAAGGESGLRWEFPGGKVEEGEEPELALERELVEELGVRVSILQLLGRGEAVLGAQRIVLDVFAGRIASGEPRALEHRRLRWCSADELAGLEWADADVPVVPAVQRWLECERRQSAQGFDELGQPVGAVVDERRGVWEFPVEFSGEWCRLVKLSPEQHAADLFAAYAEDRDGRDWTYLSHGPFASMPEFESFLEAAERSSGYFTYAMLTRQAGRVVGMLSLLRNEPSDRSVEVGAIHFAPSIQRSPATTEAIFLLARHVFDSAGYRRLEWKCDALNERSRASAVRLGFSFEGVFRQHKIYKGRNRDTAWYAIVDHEWPLRREALERWLSPSNFDSMGRQREKLSAIRASLLDARRD